MSKQQGGFQIPPNLAIAEGATTPDPGGTSARGVIVWSTTLSAMVRWSGTAWNEMASGGGGGLTFPQVYSIAQMRI